MAELKFPVWTWVGIANGLQEIGSDEDGTPQLPVWETAELCASKMPSDQMAVWLDPPLLEDRLLQMPGDSTLAIYTTSGIRYRLPAKKALEYVRALISAAAAAKAKEAEKDPPSSRD